MQRAWSEIVVMMTETKESNIYKETKINKMHWLIYWFSFYYGVKMEDMPRMRLLLRVYGVINQDGQWKFWWGNYGRVWDINLSVKGVYLIEICSSCECNRTELEDLWNLLAYKKSWKPYESMRNFMKQSKLRTSYIWLLKDTWITYMKSLSHVRLFATPWTAAHQGPPSMGFSR